MTTDSTNVRPLPGRINLDLDAAQRPEKEVKDPFVVMLKGREIEMKDPALIDWRDLLLMDSPVQFLRFALSDEDRKFLLAQEIEGWRFQQLMEAYEAHFDLNEKVQQARRQQQLAGL